MLHSDDFVKDTFAVVKTLNLNVSRYIGHCNNDRIKSLYWYDQNNKTEMN